MEEVINSALWEFKIRVGLEVGGIFKVMVDLLAYGCILSFLRD